MGTENTVYSGKEFLQTCLGIYKDDDQPAYGIFEHIYINTREIEDSTKRRQKYISNNNNDINTNNNNHS